MTGSVTRSATGSVTRSVALGLCATALLAVASCSHDGSYRLSWVFEDQATKATESTATGCGRHYVDSLMATGIDDGGDVQQIVAPCISGWMTASATPGTWSFSVQMLDAQGALLPSDPSADMTTRPEPIVSDGPQTQFSVTLSPL